MRNKLFLSLLLLAPSLLRAQAFPPPSGGGGGGDSVTINSSSVTDPDFADAGVPAPTNGFNVKWQKSGSSVSAYLPTTAVTGTIWGSSSPFTWEFNTGADPDPYLTFNANDITVSAALLSPIFSSTTADPADAGVLRLANGEQVCWEASPTGTDFCITGNPSGQFTFTGSTYTEGSIPFFGAGGILAQDNANLFWDNSTDILRVGPADNDGINLIGAKANGDGIRLLKKSTDTFAEGAFVYVEGNGGGTGTDVTGIRIATDSTSATSGYNWGLRISTEHDAGALPELGGITIAASDIEGGTVVDNYGLKIGDQTLATNNWSAKFGLGKFQIGAVSGEVILDGLSASSLVQTDASKGLVSSNDLPAGTTLDGDAILVSGGDLSAATYSTATNCADSAGAAACGAAPAGSFVIDAGANTTVVSTTAVTDNSQIFLQIDASLGTRLSVTCNTGSGLALGAPRVIARTAATSFTADIDIVGGPVENPLCLNFWIVN